MMYFGQRVRDITVCTCQIPGPEDVGRILCLQFLPDRERFAVEFKCFRRVVFG